MEGSITQLGLSNYLINNKEPSVSFFRHGYKNYSNFVRDTRRIPFKGDFNFGNRSIVDLNELGKYGDLITNIVVEVDLPDISSATVGGKSIGYCNGVGNALIKETEMKINGGSIDKQSSEWMDIWSQLSTKPGLQSVYNRMIKKYDDDKYFYDNFQGGKIYIPLQYWFCQYSSSNNRPLVFPLAAVNNSKIELIFSLRNLSELISIDGGGTGSPTDTFNISDANLLVDFITLEEKERLRLQNSPRQLFVMTQVQEIKESVVAGTIDKTVSLRQFKYPVSEIFWVLKRNDASTNKMHFSYGKELKVNTTDPITKTRISFEGQDRVPELSSDYFSQIEPFKVHDNTPSTHIHCYSFSLEPENMAQPAGICNFSNLSEPQLHFEFDTGVVESMLHIYAINYNVLQVDDKGNAWLLHNLSKSAPDSIDKDRRKDVCQ